MRRVLLILFLSIGVAMGVAVAVVALGDNAPPSVVITRSVPNDRLVP